MTVKNDEIKYQQLVDVTAKLTLTIAAMEQALEKNKRLTDYYVAHIADENSAENIKILAEDQTYIQNKITEVQEMIADNKRVIDGGVEMVKTAMFVNEMNDEDWANVIEDNVHVATGTEKITNYYAGLPEV
ncbi:hypothetical protein EQG49_13235 [Periweissella cryptocerci]|uniref:Uncharacterized protein n=1 Tax=Periweissella cryptocerci TaxID=2506420 RepID=A0A4P6YWY4_9LACO|nr:hypothetical protein [Periweissella cryptocerci]QBO37360.1 hypothetical protein EQG49_13235 [Periweissella cryptocerci]